MKKTSDIMKEMDSSESLLFGYAAGMLDETFRLLAASYAAVNAQAARTLRELEAVAGAMLAEMECAQVSQKCRESLLARLDDADCIEKECRDCSILPEPLLAYTKAQCDAIAWKRYIEGFEFMRLATPRRAELIRMNMGRAVPRERRPALEYTLVLDGGLVDDGREWHRGDLVIRPKGHEYHTSACDKYGCVALIVTDGGPMMPSMVRRILRTW